MDNKDGVTLIADAIRREQEELKKTTPVVQTNVSDVTAQFTSPKPKQATTIDDTTKTETENITETKNDNQEDN